MSKLELLPPPSVPMPADRVMIADELVTEGYQVQQTYELRISPDNRKWFDVEALNGLAGSMQSVGVLQPLVVRPVQMTAEQPQRFEIVAGERRFRSAIIAALSAIPVMVRKLSDAQAAEIRLLENIQREDPHPLEEADGYQQLMQAFGYDVKKLIEITKKSRAYIYASLKLCALSLKAREIFMADKESFPASTALLIARIPSPDLQNKALDEILAPRGNAGAMSFREAKRWIQDRYMLNLSKATFPIKDAKLLRGAGSCTECPKRAGNQSEVFEGINADVCTDPDCFAEKVSAHKAAEAQREASVEVQARKAGIPVHEGEATRPFYSRIYLAGYREVVEGTPLYTFERVKPKTKMAGNVATYLRADDMPHPIAYLKEAKGLTAIYDRKAVQQALEQAGACFVDGMSPCSGLLQVDDNNSAPSAANVDAVKIDVVEENLTHQIKETIAEITTRRADLYMQIRGRVSTHGMSTQLLREIVKLLVRDHDNNCTFPDDLIGHLFRPEDFDGSFSDASVCAYIDRAPHAEVQLLLMDIVISEQLSAGIYERQTSLADSALAAMDVAMPDRPSEDAPRKTLSLNRKTEPESRGIGGSGGPIITVKKTRTVPASAWPFPTDLNRNA